MTFRLLLVEDHVGDNGCAADGAAKASGFNCPVDQVTTLADAIAALESNSYDGIIVGLGLPAPMLAAPLKRLAAAAGTAPIITLSQTHDPDLQALAETQGALHLVAAGARPAQQLSRSILAILGRSNAAGVAPANHEFESLIGVMPDAVIVTTLDGEVQFINPAAEALFGREHEELMGERIGFSVKEGHVSEIEILRADEQRFGEIRVAECMWNGQPAFLAMIRDITEQKRLSKQLRLMVNELNHRVKNTLATVQGIALQSLRDAEPMIEAREAFMRRLFAFAKTHDVLTAGSWSGANLDEVANAAVNFIQDKARTRIRMDGPSIWLRPRAAFVLSLVLNELATNALKYGALSNEAGGVEFIWRVMQADGVAPRLALNWREANGPPVKPPTRRGFGSRLIEDQLAVELDGEVRCEFAPAGLICAIELPYTAIVE